MRVEITLVQIYDIVDKFPTIDDVRDSIVDSLNDAQDTTHETSDGKIEYIPKEIVKVEIKEVS